MSAARAAAGLRQGVAVDAGSPGWVEADHVVHLLGQVLERHGVGSGRWLATHVARGAVRHVVVSATWDADAADGPVDVVRVAADARDRLLAAGSEAGSAALPRPETEPVLAGPERPAADARAALEAALVRRSGRLVDYPGRAAVEVPTTTSAVLAGSGIDAVRVLGGATSHPGDRLDLTGHARPEWRDGACVLLVQPGRGGLIAFEQRHQMACCADH